MVPLQYLTCLQMCMQLPLLPRHPSVYISPVICPVETALILSAQTPFSVSSPHSGFKVAQLYIHIERQTVWNMAPQVRMIVFSVSPPYVLVIGTNIKQQMIDGVSGWIANVAENINTHEVHKLSQDIRNKCGEKHN